MLNAQINAQFIMYNAQLCDSREESFFYSPQQQITETQNQHFHLQFFPLNS